MKKRRIAMVLTLALIVTMLSGVMSACSAAEGKTTVRAVWLTTLYNLDFPKTKQNSNQQKTELVGYLDNLKAAGINTIIFQVRPKADAFYKSNINPWSEYLTGTQGKDPGYDPLQFAIEEAHKRGMELHAWMNPYRVTMKGEDVAKLAANHPAKLHPDWIISHDGALYYNPEIAGVKEHIRDTVKEVVDNYKVDGIHFDDYFYPSDYPLPVGEGKDGAVANARRQNVDEMVALVHSTIKNANTKIQFGISPMGIWKNSKSDSTGSNTNGKECYYSVFSDVRSWIKAGTVDYIVPQIYWEIGYKIADYETLVAWWAKEVKGSEVELYIGQAVYRESVAAQIDQQLAINKKYPEVSGSFYFRAEHFLNNLSGCKDKISAFYKIEDNSGASSGNGNEVGTNPPTIQTFTAAANAFPVLVDGKTVNFEAYNINGYNYFKLRDLAFAVSGTSKQFDIGYDTNTRAIDIKKETPYTTMGGELAKGDGMSKTATTSLDALLLSGQTAKAEAYNIQDYNYYKLRDLGDILNIKIDFVEATGTVMINTNN